MNSRLVHLNSFLDKYSVDSKSSFFLVIFLSFLFYFSRWCLGSWKSFCTYFQRARKSACCPHLCWSMMWTANRVFLVTKHAALVPPELLLPLLFFEGGWHNAVDTHGGRMPRKCPASFLLHYSLISTLTNSAESLVSVLSSAPNLTLVVSLYIHCFPIQLSSCAS